MVVLRYFFGWWPAKLPTVLNIVLMIGYCCIGQYCFLSFLSSFFKNVWIWSVKEQINLLDDNLLYVGLVLL